MVTAIFGINNDGLSLVVNLLILMLVVVWLALIVYTYLDARRRISDPFLVGCATLASFIPYIGTAVYAIVRPPEFLEDAHERELEIKAAELRVRELTEHSCPAAASRSRMTSCAAPSASAASSNPARAAASRSTRAGRSAPTARSRWRRSGARGKSRGRRELAGEGARQPVRAPRKEPSRQPRAQNAPKHAEPRAQRAAARAAARTAQTKTTTKEPQP